MARCGYPAHEAVKLPSWLFWAIVESDQKDATRSTMETYKATGAGAGGFVERSREEIINSWNDQLTTPIRGAVIEQQREILEMDWKVRAKMWGG